MSLDDGSLRDQVREAWWRFDPIGVREARSSCADEYDTYIAWTVNALFDAGDVEGVVRRAVEAMGGLSWLGVDQIEGFLGELRRLQ